MVFSRPEVANEHMTAQDAERLTQGVNSVLAAITPRLKDFHNLLLDPPKVTISKLAGNRFHKQ